MSRLPLLPADKLTPRQKEVHDAIVSGPRGQVLGPLAVWLYSPDLADRAQKLGEYVRFNTALEPRLSEMAILVVGRHWDCQFEWYAHEPIAARQGLSRSTIESLRAGKRPDGMKPDEAALYDFATEFFRTHKVSDQAYAAARQAFGEKGVVDLIGILGYYSLAAITLNASETLPPGEQPLKPLR